MTHRQEAYVLDSLDEVNSTIRGPAIRQLVKETHENNIMLRQIVQYLKNEMTHASQENMDDFGRNVLANIVSSKLDIREIFKRR